MAELLLRLKKFARHMTYIQLFCKGLANRKWAKQNFLTWTLPDTDRLVFFLMLIRGEIKEKWHFLCHKLPKFVHKCSQLNVKGP